MMPPSTLELLEAVDKLKGVTVGFLWLNYLPTFSQMKGTLGLVVLGLGSLPHTDSFGQVTFHTPLQYIEIHLILLNA